MITRERAVKWLQDYVAAWKSYDKEAIRALFSEDAIYRYNPFDEGVRGREAIVAEWLDGADKPNTYEAEYKPIAVEGDTAVAQGRTYYYEADGKTLRRQFDNIFVLRFDEEGRCKDFCEWFMQPRG
jgi:ketosteroid isomerase-like protein